MIAIFVLSLPAWLPWLEPDINLWDVDDAKNHLIRLYHLEWLIRHGVWYPRWVPEMFLGYGYPVFNYYAPAFYYLALLLRLLLRLDFWDAFRVSGVVAALLGAYGCYAITVTLWRRATLGLVAAALALYAPYVFQINLYKRGDIPEALALALIPWLLLALWRLWHAASQGAAFAWSAGSAGLGAAVILTHNLTALLAAAAAAAWTAYLLLARPSPRGLLRIAAAGALAVGATAFFWLPAIGEVRYVQADYLHEGNLDYRSWLVDPAGESTRHKAPENRQTRTGLIERHLVYPQQLVAPPKIGLVQVAAAALAALAIGATAIRRLLVVGHLVWAAVFQRAGLTPGFGTAARRVERGAKARYSPADVAESRSLGGGEIRTTTATSVLSESLGPPRQEPWMLQDAFTLVPLLGVAVVCWLLTFTFAAPAWQAIPGLPLLQFPWRLLGPLGICLAIAGAGALAGPLAWIGARAGRWGQIMIPAGAGVLIAGIAYHGAGDRDIPHLAGVPRVVDARVVLDDERRDQLGMGTTSGREFLPRDVSIATYEPGRPRGRTVLERLYPEGDWLGGRLYPLEGTLRILDWRAEPLRLSARVANDGATPAALGIRQTRFPGWRAWLDGAPARLEVAPYVPEQQTSAGFIVIEVPPGEHVVSVAFGPTRLRLIGLAVTVAYLLSAAAVAVLWLQHWSPALSARSDKRRKTGAQSSDHSALTPPRSLWGRYARWLPCVRGPSSVVPSLRSGQALRPWSVIRRPLAALGASAASVVPRYPRQSIFTRLRSPAFDSSVLRPSSFAWLLLALSLAYLSWRDVRGAIGRFAILPLPHDVASQRLTNGVWRVDFDRQQSGLLVNVAEAVRLGAAQISSPSGATLGPGGYVDVRYLTITDADDPGRGAAGTSTRDWLYLHPPAQVTLTISLPAGRDIRFQAALAMDPVAWQTPTGDGISFQVFVEPLDRAGRPLPASLALNHVLNPRAYGEQRRWVPVEGDLSPWAGQTVRLTLRTDPRDDLTYDWGGWGNPIVWVRESARAA